MSSDIDLSATWMTLPGVHEWYNHRATRGRADTWFRYCLSSISPESLASARLLSVGCATGGLERSLDDIAIFERCDGIDSSGDDIALARDEAQAQGRDNLYYEIVDLNEVELPVAAYDAVWLNMTLGRVREIEHLIDQIAGTLKPGGFLFANEYIGASRFAIGATQRAAIEAAFSLIPRRLRSSDEAPLPGPKGIEDDPWRIRSEEIVPTLRTFFTLNEFNPICGSLLQILLNSIAGNIKANDHVSTAVIEMLMKMEECLVDTGELHGDFALIIASPKR